VFIVVYFIIESVLKLLDTPSYVLLLGRDTNLHTHIYNATRKIVVVCILIKVGSSWT